MNFSIPDLPAQANHERELVRPPIEPVLCDTDPLRGFIDTEKPILLVPVSAGMALGVEQASGQDDLEPAELREQSGMESSGISRTRSGLSRRS
jgi:hypothetical protein